MHVHLNVRFLYQIMKSKRIALNIVTLLPNNLKLTLVQALLMSYKMMCSLLTNFFKTTPVRIIFVETGVVGLEWSLAHPNLFAAWGNISGCVDFYNLRTGEVIPSLQLPASHKPALISIVCCNPHR